MACQLSRRGITSTGQYCPMAVASCMLPRKRGPGHPACEMFRNLMETVGMSDFKPRNRQSIPLAPGPAGRNVELAAMYDVWQSHARSSGGVLWLS